MTTSMAPREDLINSAVTFLQDPSVGSAPLEQQKSFLQSKNLTAEEIQVALARASGDPTTQQYTQPPYYTQRQGPPPGYGYNQSYPPHSPWPQYAEPPRRDWRDWFIMATVTTGLGWGLYSVAKRYITPLILPPTAPQLESDKSSIDASFTKAFDLIEQLSTDTAALKDAETQRQQKLDSALEEVTSVIAELKAANKRREDESRRLGDEVRGLRDMIPKALDGWKAQGDERVKELGSELRSLKVLIGNRVGTTNNTTNSTKPAAGVAPASTAFGTVSSGTAKMNTIKFGESASTAPANHSEPNVAVFSPGITTPHPQTGTATPFNFESRSSGRSIPAWQMAAAAKGANTATTAAATTTLAGAGNHVGEGSGQQQQQ